MKAGRGAIADLLGGCHAGVYTLPDEVTAAEGAIDILEAAHQRALEAVGQPDADPDEQAREAVAEAVRRARAGKEDSLIDHGRLAKAQVLQEQRRAEARLLEVALTRAAKDLSATVMGEADTILTHHLQPAFDRVVGEARNVAPDLGGALDPAAVLKAGGKAVGAWNRLEHLAAEYRTIRTAWRVLFDLAFKAETEDVDARFGEMENLPSLWPLYYRAKIQDAPWPQHPVARLAWLVTNGATLWLPHADDLDRVVRDERDRISAVQAGQRPVFNSA